MEIKVYRSSRRKKTVAARFTGKDEITVYLPESLTIEEERKWVDRMVRRAEMRTRQESVRTQQSFLEERARRINERYFDGELCYSSIRYVVNQSTSAGSCSTGNRSIRIADRIARMPLWVLDYVVMHELCHLVQPDHSPAFWRLVERYPMTERARGYLMACNMEPDSVA